MKGIDSKLAPDWLNVSRETLEQLEAFVSLVEKWNPAINLVSKRSISELWERHVLDSAQLFQLFPVDARHLVDLGSGGGFPGIVLAILARGGAPKLRVTLVESDKRKATFLSEAVRLLGLNAVVSAERIEAISPLQADVVTARALGPLGLLCVHLQKHLHPSGQAFLSKGAQVVDEIAEARLNWSFSLTEIPSKSDPMAKILQIEDLRHV